MILARAMDVQRKGDKVCFLGFQKINALCCVVCILYCVMAVMTDLLCLYD